MECANCKHLEKELTEQLEAGFEQAYEDIQKLRRQVEELEIQKEELLLENEKLKDWIRSGQG